MKETQKQCLGSCQPFKNGSWLEIDFSKFSLKPSGPKYKIAIPGQGVTDELSPARNPLTFKWRFKDLKQNLISESKADPAL